MALNLKLPGDSDITPDKLEMISSGLRISDVKSDRAVWSTEDQSAFSEFLSTRSQAFIEDAMLEVKATRKDLKAGVYGQTNRILAMWFAAGVHPAQEDGWDASDVGAPTWDTCDLLAALGQIRKLLPMQQGLSVQTQVLDRINGVWVALTQELNLQEQWPDVEIPVRTCAEQLRQAEVLKKVPEDRQKWIHDQAIVEIIALWNALGDGFRAAMPQPYGIVELVVCSPEANRYFDRDESPDAELAT